VDHAFYLEPTVGVAYGVVILATTAPVCGVRNPKLTAESVPMMNA
jgi:hypothetical protein